VPFIVSQPFPLALPPSLSPLRLQPVLQQGLLVLGKLRVVLKADRATDRLIVRSEGFKTPLRAPFVDVPRACFISPPPHARPQPGHSEEDPVPSHSQCPPSLPSSLPPSHYLILPTDIPPRQLEGTGRDGSAGRQGKEGGSG
jgi:hypothetical protein